MKTLSSLVESLGANAACDNCTCQPQGVTNHLTPIYNIIVNVKNFFGIRLGVAVDEGEDHVSIKLHSSAFISPEAVNAVLDTPLYHDATTKSTLRSYIISQGLDTVKMVYLGQFYVVYFCPSDIRTKENPDCVAAKNIVPTACKELKESGLIEAEMETINLTESYDDEEIEDKTFSEMIDLLKNNNKIKAAEKLSKLVADEIELPKEYYFKAVKDAEGEESVALRYKVSRRRPHGKTMEVARSLMNIYGVGDEAVFVAEFENKDKMDDDMKNLIESILRLIGAKPTDDELVYSISENPDKDADKKDDDKNDDKNDDDNQNDDNQNDDNNQDDYRSGFDPSNFGAKSDN